MRHAHTAARSPFATDVSRAVQHYHPRALVFVVIISCCQVAAAAAAAASGRGTTRSTAAAIDAAAADRTSSDRKHHWPERRTVSASRTIDLNASRFRGHALPGCTRPARRRKTRPGRCAISKRP